MIKNLVEEHVTAAYDTLRPLFPAYCGCDLCRDDVLAFVLNRVPPRYVARREGAVVTEINLEKEQSRAAIEVVVMEALRKISVAPLCGKRGGATQR
ncbi:MAG TPA: late competence development ComFB family protein [Gemmatimonadales bacterium]|nr:late competence development ComFB family protein [Gemmatimonadales bacterium]